MDQSIRGDDATAFEPMLNAKVDELFLRWISMPQQSYLFEQLQKAPFHISPTKKFENKQVLVVKSDTLSSGDGLNDRTKPILSPRRVSKDGKQANLSSKPKEKSQKPKLSRNDCGDFNRSVVDQVQSLSIASKIPRFHFPFGKPSNDSATLELDKKLDEVFTTFGRTRINLPDMDAVCKACGCPVYWKSCLFEKSKKASAATVTKSEICLFWKNVSSKNHDDASKFVSIFCKDDAPHLDFEDFLPLLKDIVDTHPGLSFLKDAPEFHTRYMNTVIARIFYTVNRSWSGKITVNELRRSNFLSVLKALEDEQDINSVTDYFSYEHFYVIYCKFWELDTDHDLFIDANDLARHGDGVMGSRLVSRLMSGAVQRANEDFKKGSMSYIDFVWFLISEEDKTTKTSVEYWFRCMDLDGDGYISLYEMEHFYEEQVRKLELLDIEPLPFIDCACSMLDMIRPAKPDCVSLGDLKQCGQASIFFNTFLNVEKYLENEQKDPFSNPLPEEDEEAGLEKPTDWERYASVEYELLVAEEQANEADAFANMLDEVSQNRSGSFQFGSNETSW